MIKSEIERISNYYYGKAHILQISFEEFIEISESDNVLKLFEIFDEGYVGSWFYVIKKQGHSVAINYGLNTKELNYTMQPYMKKHNGKRVNAEEIKMYKKGIYPSLHYVDYDYLIKYCDFNSKTNNSDYDYLYAEHDGEYYAFGKYNNISFFNKYETEDETIKNLLSLNKFNKNISDEFVHQFVIDERKIKDFELIV